MRRQRFTPPLLQSDQLVRDARASSHGRIEIRDTSSPLILMVTAKGARSFTTRPRLNGRSIRLTYQGSANIENYPEAKAWADQVAHLCAKGLDPRQEMKRKSREAEERLFRNVVSVFMERHASRNRTVRETQRIFERYVLPEWGDRLITAITRRDAARLLDQIEDGKMIGPDGQTLGGPVMADRTLAAIRKLMNWYAARNDEFVSPIVPGMARTRPKERVRDRVLSDQEIRVMWPLLDDMEIFGALTQTLLLTGQRRGEVADMKRSEIDGRGIWTIPAERYKTGRPNVIPLSGAALAIIRSQPIIDGSDFVFTTTGKNPFSGFSKAKSRLDGLLLEAMREEVSDGGKASANFQIPIWNLHDLRRTAKTLMMRAGIRPDISERVLGHVIPGVEGVYDHHGYLEEKRDALEKLAEMIKRFVGRSL